MSANNENRRETGDSGAREMMQDASDGRSISSQYNALSPQEQRAALTDMRNLQKSDTASFGNVELIDGNADGILDDARSTDSTGRKTDVYDPAAGARVLSPREISADANLREADSILKSASQGQDVYGKIQRSRNPNLLDDLRAVQASKPQYGNVTLIDSNGDGQIDDVRALRAGRSQEEDVYKTPADKEREKIEARTRQAIQNGQRIILEGVLGGEQNKRKGSTTERVGREGRRVVGDILKDMGL